VLVHDTDQRRDQSADSAGVDVILDQTSKESIIYAHIIPDDLYRFFAPGSRENCECGLCFIIEELVVMEKE